MGVHFGIPSSLERVEWYGRGPHESYPDRKWGAPLRIYSLPSLQDLHVPYIFPGELERLTPSVQQVKSAK